MIYPNFVDHLVFRVIEIGRTEQFYTALLGPPVQRSEGSLMYIVGDTRLFFTCSAESRQRTCGYDKEKAGLNHMAFGVRTLKELQAIQAQLDAAGISHSGIKLDR